MKYLMKLRAWLNITFVTLCPRCDRHFYGFDNYKEQHKIDNIHYRIVCHRCARGSK